MSASVKIFGCRPLTNDAAGSGGRRTKISNGGNRGKGYASASYNEARGPETRRKSMPIRLEGVHNFNDLARVLLNGDLRFGTLCDFKELGVAKIAHSTTPA
jgi:hypothetical protein